MVCGDTLSSTEYIWFAARWPDSRWTLAEPMVSQVRKMSSDGGSGFGVAVGSGI